MLSLTSQFPKVIPLAQPKKARLCLLPANGFELEQQSILLPAPQLQDILFNATTVPNPAQPTITNWQIQEC